MAPLLYQKKSPENLQRRFCAATYRPISQSMGRDGRISRVGSLVAASLAARESRDRRDKESLRPQNTQFPVWV